MFFRPLQEDKTETALSYLHEFIHEAADYVRHPEQTPSKEMMHKLNEVRVEIREAYHSLELIYYCLAERT